jgi:predicted Zn-dependent protease
MSPLRDPRSVVEEVLGALGGPGVVIVEDEHAAEMRFANSSVTTNGVRTTRSTSVIRFVESNNGVAAGMASAHGTGDFDALASAAEHDAFDAAPADDSFELVNGESSPTFETPSRRSSPEDLSSLFHALGTACRRTESATHRLFGFVERTSRTTYFASTTGLKKRHVQTTGALHVVGRSVEGKRSSWAGMGSETLADRDFEGLVSTIEQGLDAAKTQIPIDPGRHEVILSPSCVADLMVDLVDRASGRDAEEGQNVFSLGDGKTRIGERLASLDLTLSSDPHDPLLSCVPFLVTAASGTDISVFDNGAPLHNIDWMKDGVLERLRYHRSGAQKTNALFTPPVDNLRMELSGAEKSLDDMIQATKRGLLVTCLWYIREVDPETLLLTGLTRDGVYVIEDGKIIGATTNFRFNESPVDLLRRATEASVPYRTLGREFGEWENRTVMPALRIPDFHMSSVSQAL